MRLASLVTPTNTNLPSLQLGIGIDIRDSFLYFIERLREHYKYPPIHATSLVPIYLRTMRGPPLSPLQVDSVPSGPLKVQITSSRITIEMALVGEGIQ